MNDAVYALLAYANETGSLSYRLLDSDAAKDYRDSAHYSEMHREALRRSLTGDELEAFEKYVSGSQEVARLECEMLFARGVAMGIELATLGG